MDSSEITYLTFGIVLLLAVVFDLGLLSKKGATVSIKQALLQTAFWVGLALAFFGFLWYENGHKMAVEYLSAYLMEWSLSVDNIFVFILIFSFFQVKPAYYGRVLLIGILIYTGISMFRAKEEDEMDVEDNRVYKFLKRLLPLTGSDGEGRMTIRNK